MTILYLVRHGSSVEQGMIRGRLPGYPLSEKGKEEAGLAAEFLADRKITHIYSSPLQRAAQTAEIIARSKGLKVKRAEQLNEWYIPEWAGKYFPQISKKELLLYALRPMRLKSEGERLKDVGERISNFCRAVCALRKEVVCVSHRDPILAGKLTLLGRGINWLNFERCKTASVTVLEIKRSGIWQTEYFEP